MAHTKTLTILIPVYNGEKDIRGLLECFAAYSNGPGGEEFLRDCELLVVNNRSEDGTLETVESFQDRIANLRIVTPDTHMPSAEENVFRSFSLAQGEFTWVLGCDDIVRFEAFPEVLQVAREGRYDLAVFNFMSCDGNGRIGSVCNFRMKERVYEGDVLSLTQRVGYWWLIAGFSGQIVRTSRVANYNHAALVRLTSPIYSHVTAYIECLAGRPAAIVNIQNVIYRIVDNDVPHWKRAAARVGVFDEYFWTLGYVRQIAYLERKGIVGRDYLVRMIETNREFLFRPTRVIFEKLLNQLSIMNSKCEPRNRMSREEFEELVTYFEDRDLLSRPYMASVRKIFDAIEKGQQVRQAEFDTAQWQLNCYLSSYLLAPNFAAVEADYEIYQLGGRFYAVHRLFQGALIERIRYLDDVEFAPIVLEAASREEMSKRIREDGIGMNIDGLCPSAMAYCSRPRETGALAWHPTIPPRSMSDSEFGKTLSPTQAALHGAQAELRNAYRRSNPFLTRVAAWVTAQHIKITRWLLKRRGTVPSHC